MKRTIIISIASIVVLLFLGYFFFLKKYSFFSYPNSEKEDNRVLIDSIKISKGKTLYWFKYEGSLSTNTESFIAISNNVCNISNKNSIVKGDLIINIDTIKNNSIYIVSMENFILLNPTSKYKIIREPFSYDRIYKHKNVFKNIFLREICKKNEVKKI